jgi:hypothetical protein
LFSLYGFQTLHLLLCRPVFLLRAGIGSCINVGICVLLVLSKYRTHLRLTAGLVYGNFMWLDGQVTDPQWRRDSPNDPENPRDIPSVS